MISTMYLNKVVPFKQNTVIIIQKSLKTLLKILDLQAWVQLHI